VSSRVILCPYSRIFAIKALYPASVSLFLTISLVMALVDVVYLDKEFQNGTPGGDAQRGGILKAVRKSQGQGYSNSDCRIRGLYQER
jgi:hypothetical protein